MENQVNVGEHMEETSGAVQSDKVRIKHIAQINPTKSEITDLESDTEVSFVGLEDFGTNGEIKDTETRILEDVYDGYTYFREGDIAIAKITPSFENGKGAICRGLKNGIGFGTTELHILRPRENVSTEFLWYVLRSKPFMDEAETAMRGVAGQQRVPTEFISNYNVQIYDIKRQKDIQRYLDTWDEKISKLLEDLSSLLDNIQYRRTAMITSKVTTGSRSFEHSSVDSKWFESLPKDWDTIQLRRLISNLEQGWSPQCNEIPSKQNEWGVLKVSCVNDIYFNSNENKQLPKELDPKPELEVKQGDVIMSRANAQNLVGSCAIAVNPDPKLMLSDKLYRFNWDHSICLPKYLVYALNTTFAREQILLSSSGFSDSMVNISQKSIKNIEIPLPPLAEQEEIIQHLDNGILRNSALQKQVVKLSDLLKEKRQALITAAVTGQIDVSEAQGES